MTKKNLLIEKIVKFFLCSIFLASLMTYNVYAACGTKETIQIAEMNWQSAGTLAHIVDKVLKHGLGCKTTLVPGDTVPTGTSMLSKGKPHIAPELWVGSLPEIWGKAEGKKLYKANDIFADGGNEGWWIPDYVAEANPGLKSITDLAEYAHLFKESGTGDKGRFYSCPPGWACEIVNENLFKALNMGEKYELFSPGSGANLDASIARKVSQKKPILTYYWDPTAIVGKYKLVKLNNPVDKNKFKCLTDKNCNNPMVSGYPPSPVYVVAVNKIKKAKNVNHFLQKLQIPNNKMNETLAWMDNNKASYEETATHFLKNNESIWTKWVPASVAKKVKRKL